MKRLIRGQKAAMVNEIVDKFINESAHMWYAKGIAKDELCAITIRNARRLSNDLYEISESLLLVVYDRYVCNDNRDCIQLYFTKL